MVAVKKKGKRSFDVRLRTLPMFQVLFYQSDHEPNVLKGWQCKVGLKALCSRTGEEGMFGIADEVTFKSRPTVAKVRKHVLEALVRMFTHEVREGLKIDFRRAFPDPHKPRFTMIVDDPPKASLDASPRARPRTGPRRRHKLG